MPHAAEAGCSTLAFSHPCRSNQAAHSQQRGWKSKGLEDSRSQLMRCYAEQCADYFLVTLSCVFVARRGDSL